MAKQEPKRCAWPANELAQRYHDEEDESTTQGESWRARLRPLYVSRYEPVGQIGGISSKSVQLVSHCLCPVVIYIIYDILH